MEQRIRPLAVGRKNWYFSDSQIGADSNAICYSILQTAKSNGVNGTKYIQYLLEKLPNLPNIFEEGVLEGYLPWAKNVIDLCSNS